ncbi:MAG: hypothetical protein FD141_290 [Fusobacteria bacterium]|nr:MAG: hypothetical protein FD141_290 [Fusobacteriota bacterium]KAF0229046.1 MAG: hypothetical protein FD182_1302 [Fusobacteriota bacterium]
MLIVGVFFGFFYHYLAMPIFGDNVFFQCLGSGVIFGFTSYFIVIKIIKKYYKLEQENKKLERDIDIDKLTGLYNRRAFDKFSKVISKTVYSLIFIDIDNFRKFNNKYGHEAGDKVLQKVSDSIKNNIREIDQAFRYGGDEIVVILSNCNKDNAIQIGEKIRNCVRGIDNSPQPSINISLGVASCPEDGDNILDIIRLSDQALLESKKIKENRFTKINNKE